MSYGSQKLSVFLAPQTSQQQNILRRIYCKNKENLVPLKHRFSPTPPATDQLLPLFLLLSLVQVMAMPCVW
jgi:hypothetical protein